VRVLAGVLAAAAVLSAFGAFLPRHIAIAAEPADRDHRRSRSGRRAGRRRARQVEGEVPQLLDLLAAGSTAGCRRSFRSEGGRSAAWPAR
jgi:hypothetical protein